MGKKSHGKLHGRPKILSETTINPNIPKKLSLQKRNEVNNLIEKLLKVSSNIQSTPNVSQEWENHVHMQNILDKIVQVESEMKVAVADRSAGFGDFISWMKSNGAEVDGVKIAHFSGYDYGLQAEKDFEEGELMIAVPRKLMMSADNAKDSVLGPLMRKDPMLQHMPNVALSLLLLAEKFNPDSFWRPYIKVLPTLYTTVLYFTTSELQELKGSPTLEPTLKQCRNIARQYAYFSKLFQNTTDPASDLLRDVFTYEQYWLVWDPELQENIQEIKHSQNSSRKNCSLDFSRNNLY